MEIIMYLNNFDRDVLSKTKACSCFIASKLTCELTVRMGALKIR